jgi:bacterioferritin-associated ferredoxin
MQWRRDAVTRRQAGDGALCRLIVCSCAVITSDDIHRTIAWMRAASPDTIITPGKLYRALGKSPECGGCIALFVATMRQDRHTAVPPAGMPAELLGLRLRPARKTSSAST